MLKNYINYMLKMRLAWKTLKAGFIGENITIICDGAIKDEKLTIVITSSKVKKQPASKGKRPSINIKPTKIAGVSVIEMTNKDVKTIKGNNKIQGHKVSRAWIDEAK